VTRGSNARYAWLAVAASGIALALACGSSDDDGAPAITSDGGSSSSGAASSGGSSGGASSSGASSSGASSSGSTSGGPDGATDGGDAASPAEAFVYLGSISSSEADNVVLGFKWSSDGSLVPIDMDPAISGVQGARTGGWPYSVAASPSGKWLYSAYFNGLAGFSVNQATGVLTRISLDADAGNDAGDLTEGVDFVATDPKGRLLYATSGNSLLAYTIDDLTGKLTLARSAPTVAQGGSAIAWIVVDAQARFLVVGGNGAFAMHRLDAVSGLPLATDGGMGGGTIQGAYTGNFGGGQSIHPSGSTVYSIVGGYSVDPTTLALTDIGGGSGAATSQVFPFASIAHPDGGTVFAAGYALGGYVVGDGGALVGASTAFHGSSACHAITLDPTGLHFYAACRERVYVADINAKTGTVALRDASVGTPFDGGGGYGISRNFAWIPR
jgi:hypothetical protein